MYLNLRIYLFMHVVRWMYFRVELRKLNMKEWNIQQENTLKIKRQSMYI